MFNAHASLCYVPTHFQHTCFTTQLFAKLTETRRELQATMLKLQKLEVQEEGLRLQLNAMGLSA
jgi:hypothetical protein